MRLEWLGVKKKGYKLISIPFANEKRPPQKAAATVEILQSPSGGGLLMKWSRVHSESRRGVGELVALLLERFL